MSSRGCESSSKIKTEQDHAIVMKEGVREGRDWELGIQQNDKKQSPTVEHKNHIQYPVNTPKRMYIT